MEITKEEYELIIRCLTKELGAIADYLLYGDDDITKEKAEEKYEQISKLFELFIAHSNETTIPINIIAK